MNRHRSVRVSSATFDAARLARYIESFAAATSDWEFPAEQSARYEQGCDGLPACCVIAATSTLPRAAVHLRAKGSRALEVTNIVPLVLYELTIEQYNALAAEFAARLRAHAKRDKADLRITLSKATLSLDEVIPGTKPRLFFNRYLSAYPLSGHPSDIERFNHFICSLSMFARRGIDLDAFEQLLIEEKKWPSEHAKWCRTRVEIGLELIAAYKRF